jgi:uncharacterized protein YdhG (YjbR/CyaY superfamily)
MSKSAKPTTPSEYLTQVDESRRDVVKAIHAMILKAVPQLKPSIQYGMIGYGCYHYKYDSGREGEAPIIALANQKTYISVYGCGAEIANDVKNALPKANFGKGCIRFRNPEDVDLKALEKIVKSAARAKQKALKAAAK